MSNYKNIYLSDILTNVKKNLNILEIKILIIYVMCKCKGFIHISYIGNQRVLYGFCVLKFTLRRINHKSLFIGKKNSYHTISLILLLSSTNTIETHI